ncbi:hypothetical protein HK101_005454, partial [Irineochytrium annulatum]
WKGENVSTNEVLAVVSAYPNVVECNVYGVRIPNTDGRAGMASIVLPPDLTVDSFDLPTFTSHLSARLPTYARPLFLRFRDKEHEKTSTIKFQKFKYVQQGFDPDKCEGDCVWMWDGKTWSEVDAAVRKGVEDGRYRF